MLPKSASPAKVIKPPSPPITPSRSRPYGACEPEAPNFVSCLGSAVALADRSVEEAETATLTSLVGRPGLNPLLVDQATQGLRAAEEAWKVLRDRECADLPIIEAGLSGSVYQKRLACRIRRDIDRVEFLRRTYGAAQ